jgi:hypothetical protein
MTLLRHATLLRPVTLLHDVRYYLNFTSQFFPLTARVGGGVEVLDTEGIRCVVCLHLSFFVVFHFLVRYWILRAFVLSVSQSAVALIVNS